MIKEVGGIYGNPEKQTPLKGYKYYVDFNGMLYNLIDICKSNKVLEENVNKIKEAQERLSMENTLSKVGNYDFYNLWTDNELKTGLDFGFYVNNINLPKYVMKTTKINFLDITDNRPLKTSFGGELSLSFKSTFKNLTKLSLLLGIFEYYDTFEMWEKVYPFKGLTSHERDKDDRGMDAVSSKHEVGSPNIDIVLVDDRMQDCMVYRIVNPIVTSVDFGNFMYGTNAINEIRMSINYNSWYIIDGNARPREEDDGNDPWSVRAMNAFKSKLDSIFGDIGDLFDDAKEWANDIGSELPWGEDYEDTKK